MIKKNTFTRCGAVLTLLVLSGCGSSNNERAQTIINSIAVPPIPPIPSIPIPTGSVPDGPVSTPSSSNPTLLNIDDVVSLIRIRPIDGKIFLGGQFTTIDSKNPSAKLACLNSDGTPDAAFQSQAAQFNLDGDVTAILPESDGTILIGGSFTHFSGESAGRIARIDATGQLDSAFLANTGTGFNNPVRSIVSQEDHKILVAGEFTSFNGANARYMVRLNHDGTLDTQYASTTSTMPNGTTTSTPVPTSTPTPTPSPTVTGSTPGTSGPKNSGKDICNPHSANYYPSACVSGTPSSPGNSKGNSK